MASGIIYVLVNPALKGLLKIGKTTRTAEERAIEISNGTGVPTRFLVAYDDFVEDCDSAERQIHVALSQHRYGKDREFFSMKLKDALPTVMHIIEAINSEASNRNLKQYEIRRELIHLLQARVQERNSIIAPLATIELGTLADTYYSAIPKRFFDEKGLLITRQKLVVNDAEYKLREVISAEVIIEKARLSGCAIAFLIPFVLVFLFIIAALFAPPSQPVAGVIVSMILLFVFLILVMAVRPSPSHKLMLDTVTGKVLIPLKIDNASSVRFEQALQKSLKLKRRGSS